MANIDETKDLVRKIEPVKPGLAQRLWYLNLLSNKPQAVLDNMILTRLLADQEARVNFEDRILFPPPARESLAGELYMGQAIYPDTPYGEFGLKAEDLGKHILICGMTGSGKTNLCKLLLKELAVKRIPFLIFDWKGSYRSLHGSPEFRNLKVIRIADKNSDFKFNPLIPPAGVDPKHWMALLIDVIKHSFFVSYGPEYWLRKGIDELYKRWGIYDGKKLYPKFDDLEKFLGKEYVRGREMLWMSSVKRTLSILTFSGLLGEVLNVREHTNLAELFEGQVIVEMDNLAEVEKTFLVESLLLFLYQHRKAQGRANGLRNVIVVEESHHVLSRRKEWQAGDETIMESVVRMIREFGVGVIAIDQEPSKVSRSVMANTNCKICLRLGNGEDISDMASAMSLDVNERKWLEKLKVGHGVVKLSDRFSEPVQVGFALAR